jgi:hypothetical protein
MKKQASGNSIRWMCAAFISLAVLLAGCENPNSNDSGSGREVPEEYTVKNANELKNALQSIFASDVGYSDFIIHITGNMTLPPATFSQVLVYSSKTITLTGDDSMCTIALDSARNGSLFSVNSGIVLVLDKNITLKGHNKNDTALVRLNENASFVMNEGTEISNNNGSSVGGGVYIGENASFTMNGGSITKNAGGGVYIAGNGALIMNGGSITDNTGTYSIGGSSTTTGYGGGIYIASNGTFTMKGGDISLNNSNYGGGVYSSASASRFTMSGGAITGNAASYYGGGVYGPITMSGNALVKGNTASSYGSGVYTSSFVISGDARVTAEGEGANELHLSSTSYYISIAGDFTGTDTIARIDLGVTSGSPASWNMAQILRAAAGYTGAIPASRFALGNFVASGTDKSPITGAGYSMQSTGQLINTASLAAASGSATSLTVGTSASAATDGTITSGEFKYFKFTVTSGTKYYIKWNDSNQGNATKTGDIVVSAYWDTSWETEFSRIDYGWTTPRTITASKSGTIVLAVTTYSATYGGGTYSIQVYTD